MLGGARSFGERLRDAFIYAVVLVVLLFGASSVTSSATNKAVQQVAHNTELTSKYIRAQTCILAIAPDNRTDDAVALCLTAAGVPNP